MPKFIDDLKTRFAKWLTKELPDKPRTRYDVRQMPAFGAADLDVDRVHEILESAEAGNLDDMMALYRDMIVAGNHLQASFGERKEAVLGDTLSVLPVDKEDADDVATAAVIADMVEQCRSWEGAMAHALDSVLYPVALVEKTFRPTTRAVAVPKGKPIALRYELADLTPVNHELLTHINGRLQVRTTDEAGRVQGSTAFDPEPERYIVFRCHLLGTIPDNFGGPMRSIVMWALLGWNGRDWWARFLERYGAPFTVAKYPDGDTGAKSTLLAALRACTRLYGLVVSSETEIELKQASASDSGEAFDLWRKVCNEEISKLLNGVVPSDAKGTALGSDVPKNQRATKHDKRASDSRRLGNCLRYDLCEQYLAINGIKGRVPRLVWASDAPDQSQATGELLASLSNAGLEPEDEALPAISERVGFQVRRKLEPELPKLPKGPVRKFTADGPAGKRAGQAHEANEAVVRGTAALLAPQLRADFAPIVQLIARSSSPEDAIARVEAYCAALDPIEASEIIEKALAAMAANGGVVSAR